ncbi:MAG: hypothetical protein K2X93_07655 [Candidatus Obscuribacterales bacterium]|nr:hypothetical protein [Candidatus Obscuribacterales bacterium]
MKADLTPIEPSISNNSQAFAFAGLVLLLAALPYLIGKFGHVTMRDRFLSMHYQSGAFQHAYWEIYKNKLDVDILFMGGCLMAAGINSLALHQHLGQINPEMKIAFFVVTLGNQDADYFMLRELLKRRRVRFVVLQTPSVNRSYTTPHPACMFWNATQDKDMLSECTSYLKFRMYSQSIFEGLRDLVSIMRHNPTWKLCARYRGAIPTGEWVRMLDGGPFVEFRPSPVTVPLSELLYSSNPGAFAFRKNSTMSSYNKRFFMKTIKLLEENEIPFVLLHVPTLDEQGHLVFERDFLKSVCEERRVPLMGISKDRLLGGLSPKEQRLLYSDLSHMNKNGSELFTKTILHGLTQVYRDSTSKH